MTENVYYNVMQGEVSIGDSDDCWTVYAIDEAEGTCEPVAVAATEHLADRIAEAMAGELNPELAAEFAEITWLLAYWREEFEASAPSNVRDQMEMDDALEKFPHLKITKNIIEQLLRLEKIREKALQDIEGRSVSSENAGAE